MKIEDWGLIAYHEAWQRQLEIRDRLVNLRNDPKGAEEERIVECEHSPVLTVGFHGNVGNVLIPEKELAARGIECVRIERGGDVTYHGPGQVVVYPLIDLNRHGLGVKRYVELLEKGVRLTLREYGIPTTSNSEQIGVWLDWNGCHPRKICAIGVKISHGVTMHGLALNVNTDLKGFSYINPCGITDKGVTSMERELGYTLDLSEVKTILTTTIAKLIPD